MRSASTQKPPEIFAPIPDSESGVITPLVNHAAKTECLLLPILLQTSGNNLSQFADVPRKGNVDRNNEMCADYAAWERTFPARGTWIEIGWRGKQRARNLTFPARGTWIEIFGREVVALGVQDVPRKGNVDRNTINVKRSVHRNRRSPQGERG